MPNTVNVPEKPSNRDVVLAACKNLPDSKAAFDVSVLCNKITVMTNLLTENKVVVPAQTPAQSGEQYLSQLNDIAASSGLIPHLKVEKPN